MVKVSLVSLGCPKNRVDSDTLLGVLRDAGFSYTPDPEGAHVILINTCGFIEDAKRESIEEILRLKRLKREGKRLLVFGCLAERYRDELAKEVPEIDGIWGVGEEAQILEYCRNVMKGTSGKGGKRQAQEGAYMKSPTPLDRGDSYAYLKIADGCNRGCTYCVIPAIRGPYRSAEPERILRKAESHIASGAKELILVAQDISSYGRELSGYTLPSLLKDLASISGDFWVRLLYLYPTAIKNDLLSVIAEEEKICKYLDIPLQHSEDRILKAMGRGGTKRSYRGLIKKLREAIPGITIRTTFIVGFPGEREEEFDGLKAFVEEMRFDRMGVFIYSREEGTPAYGMKGNVPQKVKDKRRDLLMRLQSSISLERNKALVGGRFRALVDETDGNVAVARLRSQAPEIDGVVFLEDGTLKQGEFVDVKIVEAYDYDLRGEVAA
ncbi:MAG TPA: 30S ribosomal protein S12 methylthiotransferase RimO [Thermodesulfovibrionales bacterium]|nr:30S ribosomal protein S12 methylthiotransferase RimO [Thermodesulfovibrionales bacterium]